MGRVNRRTTRRTRRRYGGENPEWIVKAIRDGRDAFNVGDYKKALELFESGHKWKDEEDKTHTGNIMKYLNFRKDNARSEGPEIWEKQIRLLKQLINRSNSMLNTQELLTEQDDKLAAAARTAHDAMRTQNEIADLLSRQIAGRKSHKRKSRKHKSHKRKSRKHKSHKRKTHKY